MDGFCTYGIRGFHVGIENGIANGSMISEIPDSFLQHLKIIFKFLKLLPHFFLN